MNDVYEEEKQQLFTPLDVSKTIAIIAVGAVVGLVVWTLTLVIDRYVLSAIFCQGSELTSCANVPFYAESAAAIIGAVVGLFFLVRLQVFRPLLVVLAAVISLWGVVGLASLLPWYGIGLTTIMLYAFSYGLFAWISRIRAFWAVVLLLVTLVAVVRITFTL